MNRLSLIIILIVKASVALSQNDNESGHLKEQQEDTLKTKSLKELIIQSGKMVDVARLPEVQGTQIFSGKKSEVIQVQNMDVNIAEKTPRQIFAKVPGVFVYDMDGSGNQTNISTRGLDPHRGWEFNIRMNGALTNSDMYGYPASHFSLPMEAIDQIELVRGTGSLQYGAQFGGMLNYVTKLPDSVRKVNLEFTNTVGSYGLFSAYGAVHGTINKFKYFVFANKRVSNGYRKSSRSEYDAVSAMVYYEPNKKLKLKAGITRSNYLYQIPGPLTDSMFHADPQQATRSRNYFNPEIYVPVVAANWTVGASTLISAQLSAVLGYRNSVQFDKPATIADDIDPLTLTYAPRQVDIDQFKSYTAELKLLHHYRIGGISNSLVAGVQMMDNDLHRKQQGQGTTESEFDLSLTTPQWGRDLHFRTNNIALFIENSIHVTDKFTINPGARWEYGESKMSGKIIAYDPIQLPNTIKHNFPLLGVSTQYKLNKLKDKQLYAGFSQAYRPVIFKDIIPTSTYEQVDKNLKDAFGYNLEAGFRGSAGNFNWDFSVFQLRYNNRLGSQAMTDDEGNFYILRTNIGNSLTSGAELFAEYNFLLFDRIGVTWFTSTSFFDGKYKRASLRVGTDNIDVSGNKLESVPGWISRNGLTIRVSDVSLSLLYSYTDKTFADALNTVTPSKTGAVGTVPAYGVLDVLSSILITKQVLVRININNIMNEKYFTKRPAFYPGPGIWPSDGRTLNCSVQVRF